MESVHIAEKQSEAGGSATDRGARWATTGERLRRSIARHLWGCGFTPPTHRVEISVDGQDVEITGRVGTPEDAAVIATLVAMHDGVRSIVNRLTVAEGRRTA